MSPFDKSEPRDRVVMRTNMLAEYDRMIAEKQEWLEKKRRGLEDEAAKLHEFQRQSPHSRTSFVLKNETFKSETDELQRLEQERNDLLQLLDRDRQESAAQEKREAQELERLIEKQKSERVQTMVGFAILAVIGAAIVYFFLVR